MQQRAPSRQKAFGLLGPLTHVRCAQHSLVKTHQLHSSNRSANSTFYPPWGNSILSTYLRFSDSTSLSNESVESVTSILGPIFSDVGLIISVYRCLLCSRGLSAPLEGMG